MDHARLVHRCERARRAVGHEQGHLLLYARRWCFEHHRHELEPSGAPLCEPLESIEHLEAVVGDLGYTQRQLGEGEDLGVRTDGFASATQRFEAGAQVVDGYEAHTRALALLAAVTLRWRPCRFHGRPPIRTGTGTAAVRLVQRRPAVRFPAERAPGENPPRRAD